MHKLPVVDFETAKDLKELGFDWLVNKAYFQNNKTETGYNDTFTEFSEIYENHNDSDILYRRISAPEQALVIKWFRDTYDINVVVWKNTPFLTNNWSYYCHNIGKSASEFFTYEEAELTGIKEVIKHLNNDKTRLNK